MVYCHASNITVEFPIYSAGRRSLKRSVLKLGTGGRLNRDEKNRLSVIALKDVSLTLQTGDRVALVGRNGAGKTTLLRVLAGVYEPSFGEYHYQGQIASLFEVTLGMDPEGTGFENITRQGMLLGLTRVQIEERVDDILEFTELGDYMNVPVRTYSSGMRLRLAFAVSTSIDPEILLLDEWIGVGDAQFLEKANRRLEQLVERSGIMVIASHANDLVRKICNKVVLMDKGQVVQVGPVDEVLAVYENMKPDEDEPPPEPRRRRRWG